MAKKQIHKFLIIIGIFLWVVTTVAGTERGQPYSTIGNLTSYMITFIGLIFWLIHYRSTRGYFPKLSEIEENIILHNGRYTFQNDYFLDHILEFWTIMSLLIMGSFAVPSLYYRYSDGFMSVNRYCHTNQEILLQTGDIKYIDILISCSSDKNAKGSGLNYSFIIVGTYGIFKANSLVTEKNGVWRVEKIDLR